MRNPDENRVVIARGARRRRRGPARIRSSRRPIRSSDVGDVLRALRRAPRQRERWCWFRERGERCRLGRQGCARRDPADPRARTPAPVKRSSACRRAACATPICTTARARSTTTSRSCSGTRRPASSRRSGESVSGVGEGRLRDHRVARAVRFLPLVPPRTALVLLRQPQRAADDDACRGRYASRPALGIGAFAELTLVAARQA